MLTSQRLISYIVLCPSRSRMIVTFSRSPKIAERELAVDESAKLFLNETVSELGHAITYAG